MERVTRPSLYCFVRRLVFPLPVLDGAALHSSVTTPMAFSSSAIIAMKKMKTKGGTKTNMDSRQRISASMPYTRQQRNTKGRREWRQFSVVQMLGVADLGGLASHAGALERKSIAEHQISKGFESDSLCCFSSLIPSASVFKFSFSVFSWFDDLGIQRFDLGLEIFVGRTSTRDRDRDRVEIVEMVLSDGASEVRFGLVSTFWYGRSWENYTYSSCTTMEHGLVFLMILMFRESLDRFLN
ncbi:hypothetical protein LWI29_024296 [Acer saccharum]|uniref:Uncharacterized protein n=1 Tax=Acer saccharum TaxID=4024 RepID=A0AA39TV27_ACESA|nr:hypothetical protein LWI29_024296 [Acer saccharum]